MTNEQVKLRRISAECDRISAEYQLLSREFETARTGWLREAAQAVLDGRQPAESGGKKLAGLETKLKALRASLDAHEAARAIQEQVVADSEIEEAAQAREQFRTALAEVAVQVDRAVDELVTATERIFGELARNRMPGRLDLVLGVNDRMTELAATSALINAAHALALTRAQYGGAR